MWSPRILSASSRTCALTARAIAEAESFSALMRWFRTNAAYFSAWKRMRGSQRLKKWRDILSRCALKLIDFCLARPYLYATRFQPCSILVLYSYIATGHSSPSTRIPLQLLTSTIYHYEVSSQICHTVGCAHWKRQNCARDARCWHDKHCHLLTPISHTAALCSI